MGLTDGDTRAFVKPGFDRRGLELQDKCRVLVFADHIDRAKEFLGPLPGYEVELKSEANPDLPPHLRDYEDLELLSRCPSQVISASTFSWWAALLNPQPGKQVKQVSMAFPYWDFDSHHENPFVYRPGWRRIYRDGRTRTLVCKPTGAGAAREATEASAAVLADWLNRELELLGPGDPAPADAGRRCTDDQIRACPRDADGTHAVSSALIGEDEVVLLETGAAFRPANLTVPQP